MVRHCREKYAPGEFGALTIMDLRHQPSAARRCIWTSWGIDAAYSGARNACRARRACRPVSFSEKAIARMQGAHNRGAKLVPRPQSGARLTGVRRQAHLPPTAPINPMYGLHEALCRSSKRKAWKTPGRAIARCMKSSRPGSKAWACATWSNASGALPQLNLDLRAGRRRRGCDPFPPADRIQPGIRLPASATWRQDLAHRPDGLFGEAGKCRLLLN